MPRSLYLQRCFTRQNNCFFFGGHVDIKCNFNVPVIKFQIKIQIILNNFEKEMGCKNAIFSNQNY